MKINTPNKLAIDLTKANVHDLIIEGLANKDFRNKLALLLSPLLKDKFPQYPIYNTVSISELKEDGTATALLRLVKKRPKKETVSKESNGETNEN
jgi:hypothetical protein